MEQLSKILRAIDAGQVVKTDQLLPAAYAELKQMATAVLAREAPGQTLQATALVHEVYLRLNRQLVDDDTSEGNDDPVNQLGWSSRALFFSAAAEAMRRILIEAARRKKSQKRGGGRHRVDLDSADLQVNAPPEDVLDLDEALTKLEHQDKTKADIVKLRYFAGLTVKETAHALRISEPTVKRHWSYAKAWLHREIARES